MNSPKFNAASVQRLVLAFTTGLLLALGARVSWSNAATPSGFVSE